GSTRRSILQRGAAVAVGVALGTSYVRPSLRSVELHEVAYASADPSGPPTRGAPTRTPTPTVVVPIGRGGDPSGRDGEQSGQSGDGPGRDGEQSGRSGDTPGRSGGAPGRGRDTGPSGIGGPASAGSGTTAPTRTPTPKSAEL